MTACCGCIRKYGRHTDSSVERNPGKGGRSREPQQRPCSAPLLLRRSPCSRKRPTSPVCLSLSAEGLQLTTQRSYGTPRRYSAESSRAVQSPDTAPPTEPNPYPRSTAF